MKKKSDLNYLLEELVQVSNRLRLDNMTRHAAFVEAITNLIVQYFAANQLLARKFKPRLVQKAET